MVNRSPQEAYGAFDAPQAGKAQVIGIQPARFGSGPMLILSDGSLVNPGSVSARDVGFNQSSDLAGTYIGKFVASPKAPAAAAPAPAPAPAAPSPSAQAATTLNPAVPSLVPTAADLNQPTSGYTRPVAPTPEQTAPIKEDENIQRAGQLTAEELAAQVSRSKTIVSDPEKLSGVFDPKKKTNIGYKSLLGD